MFVPPHPPPKFICVILTPSVMVFGGGALGRWLGHEDGALMNGISAIFIDLRETPSAMWEHS